MLSLIISTSLKLIWIYWCTLSEKLKNCIKIWVCPAVLGLLIKTRKMIKTCKKCPWFMLFWSITQELLSLLNVNLIFESFRSASKCLHYFLKSVDHFEIGVYITVKLCHRGKCHSGNCHSGERWISRPFVHSGNLNFKHTLTNDLVFHNAWKRIICHFIT